jgi:gas vesicle protein
MTYRHSILVGTIVGIITAAMALIVIPLRAGTVLKQVEVNTQRIETHQKSIDSLETKVSCLQTDVSSIKSDTSWLRTLAEKSFVVQQKHIAITEDSNRMLKNGGGKH